jgi:transposase
VKLRRFSVFQFYPDRTQSSASDFLKSYKGFLHVDGYDGYNQVCSQLSVTRVACWAHVRRKFESAFKEGAPAGKSLAELFLTEIQKLFLLEREIEPLSPLEKQNMRFEKASPIIQNIRNLIDENVNKILPRSKLGIAFGYISNEWPHLLHFLGNGLIALSNNKVENAIRPFAIGRKNWLFSHSIRGAHASAILYSLIATAKDHDLHVEEYLNDLFLKIPLLKKSPQPDYTPLLPWNWNK